MTTLVIAGHGRRPNGSFDPGATGLISKGEHRYMKEDLFPAMRKFLPKNHDVVFFDEYNVYAYGNIVELAKNYNADEVIEFHFDAAGPSASGGHVIIYSGYAPDKLDLALRDVIDEMVGIRYEHRGSKGISGRKNLANVNRTAKEGITYRLVELGFGTNKNDAKVMTDDVETYAKKLVEVITGTSNSATPKKKSAPKQKVSSTSTSSKTSTYTGNSLVDYLESINEDSSFSNRSKLARQHGISNYRGDASQNTKLLNKLRSGSTPKKSTSTSSKNVTSYTGSSLVDYLNLSGNSHLGGSSFSNRKRLANQHGISNYKGTASQNTRLLNALRGGGSSGGSGQSISQMADRIIKNGHRIKGHEKRRKWLGVDNATYQKVRAEVNRRL